MSLMRERILRNFEKLTTDDVLVRGVPVNVAEVLTLADRDKVEFWEWVCRAIGAEGGVPRAGAARSEERTAGLTGVEVLSLPNGPQAQA